MRGDNYLLALTTTTDEVTGEVKPLFAFPVQVCKATEDKAPKFDVAAPSGAKREQKWMDPATGELVEDADCPRGVFVGEEFRAIDPEAIEAINAETKITTMVALGTVALDGLREMYGDRIAGRYFLQSPAKGGSAKAYRLTFEALRAETKGKKVVTPASAVVVKRTKRTKQALGFIYADEHEGCLVMCEVVFSSQVREADTQVKQPLTVDVDQAQIDMARKVIGNLGDGTAALDCEVDESIPLKEQLIAEALAGATEFTKPTPVANTVEKDDLAAMLQASLAA